MSVAAAEPRRRVDLPVAGMDDRSRRRADRQQRKLSGIECDMATNSIVERPEFQPRALRDDLRSEFLARRVRRDGGSAADRRRSAWCRPGTPSRGQSVGERADMVLVRVRDDEAEQILAWFFSMKTRSGMIRSTPGMSVAGEGDAAIDHHAIFARRRRRSRRARSSCRFRPGPRAGRKPVRSLSSVMALRAFLRPWSLPSVQTRGARIRDRAASIVSIRRRPFATASAPARQCRRKSPSLRRRDASTRDRAAEPAGRGRARRARIAGKSSPRAQSAERLRRSVATARANNASRRGRPRADACEAGGGIGRCRSGGVRQFTPKPTTQPNGARSVEITPSSSRPAQFGAIVQRVVRPFQREPAVAAESLATASAQRDAGDKAESAARSPRAQGSISSALA